MKRIVNVRECYNTTSFYVINMSLYSRVFDNYNPKNARDSILQMYTKTLSKIHRMDVLHTDAKRNKTYLYVVMDTRYRYLKRPENSIKSNLCQ